jgi:hypothetical protein
MKTEAENNRDFQVGDKVKKTIYVSYSQPSQIRVQHEEFVYGKVIFIHDDYAYVKYQGITMEGDERISDLSHVSKAEWNATSKL